MAGEKTIGEMIGGLVRRPEEERLLLQRRARRARFRAHLNAYIGVNVGFFFFALLVAHELAPSFVIASMWGIAILIHALNYRSWMQDHREAFAAAEERVRLSGRNPLLLADVHSAPEPAPRPLALTAAKLTRKEKAAGNVPRDPLLVRCEQAAAQTRERLSGLGAGEVEALAVVDEGLDRVRELLSHRGDVALVLAEAGNEDLDAERERLDKRLRSSQDAETKALYRSQLELLESRARKIRALEGLQERTEAYAESYLAALTNLRMDAARLKTLEMPPGADLSALMQPVKLLEQQVDGMRAAMLEVAQAVKPSV